MSKADQISETLYRSQGMGQHIGFGEHPAVLVIDMQHDFCDPNAPTTLWPSIGTTFEPIRRLCAAARARRIPVFYTPRALLQGMGRAPACGD
jgi:nicotinamidase-related amidase